MEQIGVASNKNSKIHLKAFYDRKCRQFVLRRYSYGRHIKNLDTLRVSKNAVLLSMQKEKEMLYCL